MKLYNTLSRKTEEFVPLNTPNVSFYACGPTVYDFTHIGHMRTYTNNDVLKRVLTYLGYKVSHVMNVTDVGHLSGDDDSGEDKMEKGAKKYGKTVWDVAKFYTEFFLLLFFIYFFSLSLSLPLFFLFRFFFFFFYFFFFFFYFFKLYIM